MTSAIYVMNISESKRKELEKTTQPTPFLSHLDKILPTVKGCFYDMWFIDEPVPPNLVASSNHDLLAKTTNS